jgi:hypothetical protein
VDVDKIQDVVHEDGIVFLTYGGFLSQALISGMTEALEMETESSGLGVGAASNIFTVFIELSQNMMNYSKEIHVDSEEQRSEGLIVVSKDDSDETYFINSQNIVALQDKEKIDGKLSEIKTMDKDTIKKRYKELRRSGAHTHGKGGGIGFYEIIKRCSGFEYEFKQINDNKFYFHFKAIISTKKDK